MNKKKRKNIYWEKKKNFSVHTTFSPVLLLASASFCFMGQRQGFEIVLMEKILMFKDERERELESSHLLPTGI